MIFWTALISALVTVAVQHSAKQLGQMKDRVSHPARRLASSGDFAGSGDVAGSSWL